MFYINKKGYSVCLYGLPPFFKGIFGDAGNAEANFGDNRILLIRAAPGTFFAVIGGIIAVMTITNGINDETTSTTEITHQLQSQNHSPI